MLSEILVEPADWWIGRSVHTTSWSSGAWGFEGLGLASGRGRQRGWPRDEGLASMEQFAVSTGFVCYASRCRSLLLSYKSYMLGMHGTLCKRASRWFCWFTQGEEGWCMLSWGYFSWLYWTTLFEEWCMLSLEALLCYWRWSILIHIEWPTWTLSLAFHECTWVWGSDHPY